MFGGAPPLRGGGGRALTNTSIPLRPEVAIGGIVYRVGLQVDGSGYGAWQRAKDDPTKARRVRRRYPMLKENVALTGRLPHPRPDQ